MIGRIRLGAHLTGSPPTLDAARQLAGKYPDTDQGWSLRERPLREVLIGPVRPVLQLIWEAAGFLLLIACTNLANCFTRSAGRQREIAVRTALLRPASASRASPAETMILVLAGGALGALAGSWGVSLLRVFGPPDLPRLQEVHVKSAGIGFCFRRFAAYRRNVRTDPCAANWKRWTRRTERIHTEFESAAHRRMRSSLVLQKLQYRYVAGWYAGLAIRSFWLLIHVDPGFRSSRDRNTPAPERPFVQ